MPSIHGKTSVLQSMAVLYFILAIFYIVTADTLPLSIVVFSLFLLPLYFKIGIFTLNQLVRVLRGIKTHHIAWLCLFAGLFMLKGRSTAALVNNPIQAQQWLRIVGALLGGILIFPFFLKNFHNIRRVRGPLFFFWLYAIIALISSSYSSFIGYSAWKATELIIGLCVVTSMVCSGNQTKDIATLQSVTVSWNHFLLVLVVAGIFYAPHIALRKCYGAVLPLLTGVIPVINANSVGTMAALALVFCLVKATAKSPIPLPLIFYLFLFGGMLFLSNSRTSIIATFLAGSSILFVRKKLGWLLILVLLGVVVWNLAGKGDFFVDSYFLKGQDVKSESITTLSGRTHGWSAAISLFNKSPLFGYGYATGSKLQALPTSGAPQEEMHGAIFSILANNGLLGFTPWCISFLWGGMILLGKFIRYPTNDNIAVNFCFLVILGVKVITSDALVYLDIFTMFYLIILANIQLIKNENIASP